MSLDTTYGTPGWAVDSPSSDYNSTDWHYDSSGHPEGTPEYSGVPDHDYSSTADSAPRAPVGERSDSTLSADNVTHESHHHGGVLGALINLVEIVVNVVLPSGSTPAAQPTAPSSGQMIDPATGKPFTPPSYGRPDSHW